MVCQRNKKLQAQWFPKRGLLELPLSRAFFQVTHWTCDVLDPLLLIYWSTRLPERVVRRFELGFKTISHGLDARGRIVAMNYIGERTKHPCIDPGNHHKASSTLKKEDPDLILRQFIFR
jgi:hypothetical protein